MSSLFLNKRPRHTNLIPIIIFFTLIILIDQNRVNALTSTTTHSPTFCRTVFRNQIYNCPEEMFSLFTSFTCYVYLPPYVIPNEKKWKAMDKNYYDNCQISVVRPENGTHVHATPDEYDISNPHSIIYSSFDSEKDKQLWQKCYQAAMNCCQTMLNSPRPPDGDHCPHTWDGWQCFASAPPGRYTEAECPDHIYFRSEPPSCSRKVRKYCRATGGLWESHEKFPGGEWTNYTECVDPEGKFRKYCKATGGLWESHEKFPDGEWTNYTECLDIEGIKMRHYVHLGSYIVSLMALTPAIFIFYLYKQLHVPRVTMHKNLFISIFINGIVFIFFKWYIILGELTRKNDDAKSIVRENSGACKFLFVLTKYTRATNYMWMFCEGFYLHKLIVAAFAEQKNMLMYYLIGWGVPFIPVIIYSIFRITNEYTDERCWTFPVNGYEWIINGPNLLSLVVNLLFLCNIIRVLVTKLRAAHMNEPSQFRKAVRATLVLVPLFGLHFVLTIYRPSTGSCNWLEAYFYINYLLDGLQGFLVALIFCYFNGEVLYLLRRSYYRWKLRRSPRNRRFSRNLVGTQVTSFTDSPYHRGSQSQATEMNCNNIGSHN